MLAPMALCTAAVMATSCSCSRSLFVARPTRLPMKRQRQHQRQAVMILTRINSIMTGMRVAPHQKQQRQPLLRHHSPETSSLPPTLRATIRPGGSKAAAPLAAAATAASAASAAGFGGRGAVVANLRSRGRQDLFFSTSSGQTEVVANQSAGGGGGGSSGGGGGHEKKQHQRPPSDLPPQQQQHQQHQQQQQQQQPMGNTNSQLDAVHGSSMAGTVDSSSLAVLAARGDRNGHSSTSSDDLERCRGLAQNLGVPLVVELEKEGRAGGAGAETGNFRFTLSFDETGRLALGQPGSGFKPLAVDFSGGKTGHRAKNQQGTEQVVKAAALPKRRAAAATAMNGRQTSSGVSRNSNGEGEKREGGGGLEEGCGDVEDEGPPLLWDLTAGLGTDAFVLALAGWRVEMFERSAVVAAMVQDALDRARAGEDETARMAASRMSLVVGDSTDAACERAAGQGGGGGEEGGAVAARRPAVVYLDPMFPQRKKSALVKKGMQMLQALLEEDGGERRGAMEQGHDDDGVVFAGGGGGGGGGGGEREGEERRMFDAAMSVATRKVVVKRPVHGAAIVGHVAPSHAVVSKNGRFDVYVVKQ